MFSLPANVGHCPRILSRCVPAFILSLLVAAVVFPQGSASTGTGGKHIIQGKIFFPSGHKAEGSIQVKLESLANAEISVMTDSSGSFTFASLSPGNYTVVVAAGEDYEIAREAVTIDSDLNLSRSDITLNTGPRRYSVMITLQPKRDTGNRPKASVINAALAEVPDAARELYLKSLDLARVGDTAKAIDNLKTAIALYPKFPLALNELGVQYLRLGQPGKAIEPLRSATKLNPDAVMPKLNLGIALLESQQYADAEPQLRDVLKTSSTPIAHMYLGLTLAQLRNDVEAEKELKAAVELGGDQMPLAHYYLGGLYWRKKEYRLAADELEIYLRLSPTAPDAERVRATIKDLRSKS
jgi:tetratricopeptide (TPR) repeat protein